MLSFRRSSAERKTIVFHVGFHKTATTSLQQFLAGNAPYMAKQGVLYPKAGRSDGTTHGLLANLLKPENNRAAEGKECWASLEAELAKFSGDIAILSSECFLESRKMPSVLAGLCENHDVRVVLYLRRQDHWIQSVYNEVVGDSMRRHVGGVKDLREYRQGWLEYDKILKQWQTPFRSCELVVRPFERGQFVGGDIRADFVEALGLTKRLQDIDFHAGQEHANPSMPPELVEFLRRCNLLPMTYSAHRLLVDELRQLGLNWKKSKLPTNAWISGSDAVKLVQRFKQCNANIGQQYRGQARSFFEEPWPKAGNQVLDEELLTAALQHQIFDSLSQDCQNRLAQASPAIKNRVAAKAFMNKPAVDDAPRLRQVIMRQRHELRMLYRKIGELE